MGPEMIMYALQRPRFKFPGDLVYFCRIDVDDSCVFVRGQSPFRRVEDVVAEAKKRTLNVATSRIPHPASIGILALGEATGSKYNLVPYGGGNPTQVAVMSGEADIGVLPIAGVVALAGRLRVLGVFNRENILAAKTANAPPINAVFGTSIPDLYSSRSWAIHARAVERHPDRFRRLEETASRVFDDAAFREAYKKTGAPIETIRFGDRATCTEYALGMIDLADRFRTQLSAQR
jgi:tripartite-type tricarboxylate transporter receptor subunit TctC